MTQRNRNIAKFRAVPESRGDFARLYPQNEKITERGNTIGPKVHWKS